MKTSPKNNMVRKAIACLLILCFAGANAFTTAIAASLDKRSAINATNGLTTDLTQLGREGRLRENLNLEAETLQLIKVLGGNGSRQPMILDEKNENQDALVEQLAIRIANGNAPALNGKRILKLEAPTLFSHSKSDAESEAKLNAVIDNAIASNGPAK